MKALVSILFISTLLFNFSASAQNVTVTPSGITPLSGSYPRLSYDDITVLPTPSVGDLAYDLTFLCLRVYNGAKWVCTLQNPTNPNPNISAITTAGRTNSLTLGQDIAVDASGNIYVTGTFTGTTNFGAVSKTATGTTDTFVAKYNSSGNLQWVQTEGEAGFTTDVQAMCLDNSGNVFITGWLDEGTNTDIFIAKYDNSGNLQWGKLAGGSGDDKGNDITVDSSGNVYVTGDFSGTVDFSGSGAVKTSAGGTDIFITKYSTSGNLQFVQTAGGTSDDHSNSITIDASSNVYLTGSFEGTTNFGSFSEAAVGSDDIFVAKYNSIGVSWSWLKTAGGIDSDEGEKIAIDNTGNIFVTGDFVGTVNFNGTPKTAVGGSDVFTARYDNSGNLEWVQTVGGTQSDNSSSIVIDTNGNLFITGSFSGNATFGNIQKGAKGFQDSFTVKYNSSGSLQWVQTMGGAFHFTANIITGNNNNIFLVGGFAGISNFGVVSKTSIGSADMFVARIQE
jgi:uncharacterized protein (AIM24 family)